MFRVSIIMAAVVTGLVTIVSQMWIEERTEPLALGEPVVEWVPCSCNEPAVMGLSEQDFIVHQMYIQGLKYEENQCRK
jgi:hypothetical protein